jgi:hypothetical protein
MVETGEIYSIWNMKIWKHTRTRKHLNIVNEYTCSIIIRLEKVKRKSSFNDDCLSNERFIDYKKIKTIILKWWLLK